MTGGEWSSLSNYRSCCELAEAEVLLGFSHSRIFTRQTRVCAFDFTVYFMCLVYMCAAVCQWTFIYFKCEVKPVVLYSLDMIRHWIPAVVCCSVCASVTK